MVSIDQREMTPAMDERDGSQPPSGANAEVGLSPESRKILEKCTVAVPTVSNRGPVTLISRPTSSGLDIPGFHFARPAYQPPKFAARPHPPANTTVTKVSQERRPYAQGTVDNQPHSTTKSMEINT
jgi:hypothetical protein